MSVTSQQIVSLLENVLFENAAHAQADEAAWAADPAAASLSGLAAVMASSGEEKIAATVVGYYLTSLGRAPTTAEIQFYVSFAEQGLTQSQIAAGDVSAATWNTIAGYFSHSAEFASRAGLDYSLGTEGALLEAVPFLYQSVLGRAPSAAEIAYYDDQVLNGTDLGVLFREFTASPEFHADTDAQIAAALTANGTAAASGQTSAVTRIGAEITVGPPTVSTPPTGPAGPSFGALTGGTDTIDDSAMSGAHVYAATLGSGATLNDGDHLAGNGLATLAITAAGGATGFPAATLSGIAAITVSAAGGVGGNGTPFDVSGVSGLTGFSLTATGAGGDFIKTASGVAVTLDTHAAEVGVADFASLDLTDNFLSAGLDLGGNGGPVTLHDPSGGTALTLKVDGFTLTGGFDDAGNHLTSLTIQGTSATSSLDAVTGAALTQLTVSAGAVTLGSAGTPFTLGSAITSLTLSNDTGSGTNHVTVEGAATLALGDTSNVISDATSTGGLTIQAGNGINSIDVAFHADDAIAIGTDTHYLDSLTDPNLTILHPVSGLTITAAGLSTIATVRQYAGPAPDVATAVETMENDVTAYGGSIAEYWKDGTDDATYVVANTNGFADSFANMDIIRIDGLFDLATGFAKPLELTAPFTTGTDTLTSTDATQTFTATLGGASATLTANDSLHGDGNTLNIADSSGAASQDLLPVGVSLTGIAAISLTTTGNAGTGPSQEFDLSGVTGLSSVALESSGTQGDFLNSGAASSVSVTTHGIADTLSLTATGLSTLTLSGSVEGVTLTDPSGPTALTLALGGVILSDEFNDASDHLTGLTIAASTAAIGTISASALTSLTVSLGSVTFGASGSPVSLGADLTSLDLSADTDTTGTNYITLHGNGGTFIFGNDNNIIIDASTGSGSTFTFGSGINNLDLTSASTHADTVIHVAPNRGFSNSTANLTIRDGGSLQIDFASAVTQIHHDFPAATVQQMVANTGSADQAGYLDYAILGLDLWIVETASGTPGTGDTTIIHLVGQGSSTVQLSGGHIVITPPS